MTMPRPFPVANSLRLSVEGLTPAQNRWANILWCLPSVNPPVSGSDVDFVTQQVYSVWQTAFLPYQSADLTLERVSGTFYQAPGTVIPGEYVGSAAGGITGDVLSDQVAVCISWTIGQTWRGGKPRTYLAGIPQADRGTSDALTVAAAAQFDTQAGVLLNGLQNITGPTFNALQLVCMSFFSGNAPRAETLAIPITASRVNQRLDTQRRRLGRVSGPG